MITNEQDGFQELAHAIVWRAVKDFRRYARTVKKIGVDNPKADKLIYECKKIVCFIKSEWFKQLTDIDPIVLLKKLYKEVGYDETGAGKGND